GRGQSACESAALLNDAGAEVVLVCRGDVHWLGADTADTGKSKDLLWQLREMLATKSGVGPFPLNWVAEYPHLVRQLPLPARAWFSARCLRPAAASLLQPHLGG